MKTDLRQPLKAADGWLILLVALALFVLAIFALPGCQTVHGIALDIESAARYTADHTVADR